jgi:cholesterol oxidase
VRRIIGSAPIPDDILPTEYYRSTRVSLDQARATGFPTRPVELAVDWDIVRDEMAGRRVASAIAGQSFYGLNSGAKRSLDRSYVKGQPGLYVVDGAPIEGSTGLANPSPTIAALAERCMDRIVPRLDDGAEDDDANT